MQSVESCGDAVVAKVKRCWPQNAAAICCPLLCMDWMHAKCMSCAWSATSCLARACASHRNLSRTRLWLAQHKKDWQSCMGVLHCLLNEPAYHIVQAIIDENIATYGILFIILAGDPDRNAKLDVSHLNMHKKLFGLDFACDAAVVQLRSRHQWFWLEYTVMSLHNASEELQSTELTD